MQVFISYKSEYRSFARMVQSRLESWGYTTWFDMDDIPKGEYFRHAIQDGLDHSEVMVGVMTQDAFQSREVMAEWDYFLAQDKELLPLKYRECKPLYHLVAIQWIDFTANQDEAFSQLESRLKELASGELQKEVPVPQPPPLIDLLPLPSPITAPSAESTVEDLEESITGGLPPQAPINSLPPPPAPITLPSPTYQPDRASASKARVSIWVWASGLAAVLVVGLGVALMQNEGAALNDPSAGIDVPARTISPWLILLGVVGVGVVGYILVTQRRPVTGSAPPMAAEQVPVPVPVPAAPAPTKPTPTPPVTVPGAAPSVPANSPAMVVDKRGDYLRQVALAIPRNTTAYVGLGSLLRHQEYGDYALSAPLNLMQVYEDMNRQLLILGQGPELDTLYAVLRLLIQQAEQDATKTVPLLLWASEWKGDPDVGAWLMQVMTTRWKADPEQAQVWLKEERLTLVLHHDQAAPGLVEAVAAFRQAHPRIDLVLAGAATDYDTLTSTLRIPGALMLGGV
jgi:hypothetical protein